MTGAYLRVKRNDKWENIEVEHLTDDERTKLFLERSPRELVNWLDMCCRELVKAESFLKTLDEMALTDEGAAQK
jgi:hypothetical protein